jgi:hypothetical protein
VYAFHLGKGGTSNLGKGGTSKIDLTAEFAIAIPWALAEAATLAEAAGWAGLGAGFGWALWDAWNNSQDNVCYADPFDPSKWPRRKKGNQKQPGFENPDDGSIWEKDNAGHGGRKWKRWKNRKDWEKGKRREGSYDENENRIAD